MPSEIRGRIHSHRYFILLVLTLVLAVFLRAWSFHGYGLGDDPNYFGASYMIYNTGDVHLKNGGYMHRIMFWLPVVTAYKLFGVTEYAFTSGILLSDLLTIVTVYFIGKNLFNREAGITASILLAISPFNISFSTSMSTDFQTGFFMAATILFYLLSIKRSRYWFYQLLATISIICGYFVKMSFLYIMPVIMILSILRVRACRSVFRRESLLYIIIIFVFIFSFVVEYWLIGDPLGYLHSETQINVFYELTRQAFFEYTNLMFTDKPFQIRLFGLYFWITAGLFLTNVFKKGYFRENHVLWLWFFSILLALQFFSPNMLFPSKFSLEHYTLPRIFRFLAPLMPPVALLMAFFAGKLRTYNKKIFTVVAVLFLVSNACFILQVGGLVRDAQSDRRLVWDFLEENPEKHVSVDHILYIGLERFHYQFVRDGMMTKLDPKTNPDYVKYGYVVTGGARNPFYQCIPCYYNVEGKTVPANWRLLAESNKTLTYYRREPLLIWEVTRNSSQPDVLDGI